jgi:hypothetical protein
LYRRWLTDGDRVFDQLTSTSIAEALERGTARIETVVLPHEYKHLSLPGYQTRVHRGVEKGDRASTQPQPTPVADAHVRRRSHVDRRSMRRAAEIAVTAVVNDDGATVQGAAF